jgi:anti-anti-sigma regulatory factor
LDGHVCWAYDDVRGDFRDAIVAYLSDGLALGQRLMFVGGAASEEAVRTLEPTRSMVASGSLLVERFGTVYPDGRRLPNADQWALYSAATDQALHDGFTGLRVVAEVTSLVRPVDAGRDHAAWEAYADWRMANTPLSALCCFDRKALSREAITSIAQAHPSVDRRLHDLVAFQVYRQSDAIAISGEVDAFGTQTLDRLLREGIGTSADRTLDLSELAFIDHTGVRTIHDYGRALDAAGAKLTIRAAPPLFRRLSDLLGLPG